MLGSHLRALLCIALTGCCAGPDYLTFALVRHSGPNDEFYSSHAPLWGASETMKTTDEVEVIFPTEASLSPHVLEIYNSANVRVAFEGVDRLVPTDDESCEHNERTYDLGVLAPDQYQLVHRRRNGTGDPLNCIGRSCPWTTLDGDDAVALTLIIE